MAASMMRIGSFGEAAGMLRWPSHALTVGNQCLVSDSGNHRIVVFDSDGEFVRSWGSHGSGPGQLKRPRGIAVHEDIIFVADCDNHRIAVFDMDGNWLGSFGDQGSVHLWGSYLDESPPAAASCLPAANGERRDPVLSFPHALCTGTDRLYVASMGSNEIVAFSLDGAFLARFGSAEGGADATLDHFFAGTFAATQLSWPKGVCCHNDEVYVADTGNHRVAVFSADGEFVRHWGGCGSGKGEFDHPIGIGAFGGYIYTAENVGRRVQVFTPSGRRVTETLVPSCGELLGLSVDERHMYIADEDEHCVWRVARTGREAPGVSGPTALAATHHRAAARTGEPDHWR